MTTSLLNDYRAKLIKQGDEDICLTIYFPEIKGITLNYLVQQIIINEPFELFSAIDVNLLDSVSFEVLLQALIKKEDDRYIEFFINNVAHSNLYSRASFLLFFKKAKHYNNNKAINVLFNNSYYKKSTNAQHAYLRFCILNEDMSGFLWIMEKFKPCFDTLTHYLSDSVWMSDSMVFLEYLLSQEDRNRAFSAYEMLKRPSLTMTKLSLQVRSTLLLNY